MSYRDLYEKQRAHFDSGATRSCEARLDALKKLQTALRDHGPSLLEALERDLGKPPYESSLWETGPVFAELRLHIRRLRGWMKPRRVPTPPFGLPGRSSLSSEPLGLVCILSSWTCPVQLCLLPLIGALSAGNCAVLKPSSKAPETGRALAKMLGSVFPEELVAVVLGSREETEGLLGVKWDHIFFTGSSAAGRQVLQAAAENLSPVTLALGGKSPAILDPTADVKLAARRIAFGKVLNAGQSRVAPDYLLIHESLVERFTEHYNAALESFFPEGDHRLMTRIVSRDHFLRLTEALSGASILAGGNADPESLRIEPTLVAASPEDPLMEQEILGPILPVIPWRDLDWCVNYIRCHDKPPAMYIFTGDRNIRRYLLDRCSFGGGCINDCVLHSAGHRLPRSSVGAGGMGSYLGRKSFDTFSHYRSLLDRRTGLELPLRYMPYKKLRLRFIRLWMR